MLDSLALAYLRHSPLPLGKAWIERRVSLNGQGSPVPFIDRSGIAYELHLDQYVMRKLFLYGVSEWNTLRHLPPYLRQARVLFDLGANIGTYSLFFWKHAAPDARIVAFEPQSINHARLQRNLALNGTKNVTVVQAGVSDRSGTADLYFGQKNSGASLGLTELPNKESIPLLRIDDYCEEHGIDRIDVMKIDIEGAEKLALAGARNVIERSPDMVLIMEVMEANQARFGSSGEELFRHVTDLGFKAHLPKPWPMGLRPIAHYPGPLYLDNVVFIKGQPGRSASRG